MSSEKENLLGLEIEHPDVGCAGFCHGCGLSQANVSKQLKPPTHSLSALTGMQSIVVANILDTFPDIPIDLGFSSCITHFGPEFALPDFQRPISDLTLYLNSPDYNVEEVLLQVKRFLQKYPQVKNLHFSFFRGAENAEIQREALARCVPGFIDLLNQSNLKLLDLSFGGNDVVGFMGNFGYAGLDSDLSYVFQGSEGLFCNRRLLGESRDVVQRQLTHIKEIQQDSDGGNCRTIALGNRVSGKILLVNFSVLYAQPADVLVEEALESLSGIDEPQIHVGRKKVFVHHSPWITQIPGAHVDHADFLQMLQIFRQGGKSWSEIVQMPIRARIS